MALTVGYAYPTSRHAWDCGKGNIGCYIVERDHNERTGKRLKRPVLAVKIGFESKEKAQAWADQWPTARDHVAEG